MNALPRHDPQREHRVADGYAQALRRGPWSQEHVQAWTQTLLDVSAVAQQKLCVAFQGGEGSWSDTSLRTTLSFAQPVAQATVEQAWQRVRDGHCVAAWLAVHNTTIGAIPDTQAVRAQAEAWLQVPVPIQHALIGRQGARLEHLRTIYGHPRALDQCRRSLQTHAPDARLVASIDGAHSASDLRDASVAVVGPRSLAQALSLQVLLESVSDEADNTTTFELLLPQETW